MRTTRWLTALALAAGLLAAAAAPAQPPAGKEKPKANTAKSKLKVTVPQADAELQIEKQKTKTTGTTREFETPDLEAGKNFEYDFVVTWRPNNYTVMTRTKSITFKAGDDVTVDLTKDDPTDKAVIRYVPTPDDIVKKMVELGGVGKDDVVYDLGCGDGRIVIGAVKYGGAKKGIGIDIDEERVTESKANVKAAGLEGKVEIRKGDVLDVKDLSDATVVMTYMGDELNALLKPILLKTLKPGSRIVSHRFKMGDWKPEKTVEVTGEDGDRYELHLWVVGKEGEKK